MPTDEHVLQVTNFRLGHNILNQELTLISNPSRCRAVLVVADVNVERYAGRDPNSGREKIDENVGFI